MSRSYIATYGGGSIPSARERCASSSYSCSSAGSGGTCGAGARGGGKSGGGEWRGGGGGGSSKIVSENSESVDDAAGSGIARICSSVRVSTSASNSHCAQYALPGFATQLVGLLMMVGALHLFQKIVADLVVPQF